MKKKLIICAMLTTAGILYGQPGQNDETRKQFAEEWAKVSAKLQTDSAANNNTNTLPPAIQLPEKSESEKVAEESRIAQEKLTIHGLNIKKKLSDEEISGRGSLELRPQYIQIAGKSEYYITYRELLELKLYFAGKQQNRYSISQMAVTSQELQSIMQELQVLTQQDSQAAVQQGGVSASVVPSPNKAKKEEVWLNKDYGTFFVSKVDEKAIVLKGK